MIFYRNDVNVLTRGGIIFYHIDVYALTEGRDYILP